MDKSISSKFLIVMIILLLILLVMIIFLIQSLKDNKEIDGRNVSIISKEKVSVQDVIEDHGSTYLDQEDDDIYIDFANDLYSQDGSSNERYFEALIKDLVEVLDTKDYYLIDNKKEIKIAILRNVDEEDYKIIYNDLEGFFGRTDGKSYAVIDTMTNVPAATMYLADPLLVRLLAEGFYFRSISDRVGEGEKINDLYTSYLDDTLEIKLGGNGSVKNIVYKKGYGDNYITNNISLNTSLQDILSLYPEPVFGGIDKGYLGYRNSRVYAYYYGDEISLHAYGYDSNLEFEDLLEDYIESGDLDTFAEELITTWSGYDYYNYNKEEQSFQVIYPGRGVKIDIKNNDSTGITLYNNYKVGSRTKKYVKNGFISLRSDEDLIDIVESERRKNTLQ